MTKTKSTKRSLLLSALSLLLCVSMLIGSTFAWFTDSVSSTNNIIKSGNLDVELEYYDGDSWEKVTATTNVFEENTLWEPGHTEVVYLKISNLGTLALKYQLGVNIVSEIESISVEGNALRLSNYIEFGAIDDVDTPYADRAAARAAITESKALSTGYTKAGSIEAGAGAQYVALVVYMPETVGNEANYRTGEAAPEINLGVNLMATQLTSEFDSFDNQYDVNAPYGTYIELAAGADLLAAMASAEKDMPLTIKLMGDVEWPTEGHHGENDITPASSILIDGNGYTITATGSGVTPLGDTEAPMTLKNVKIIDKSVSYAESSWEFTYLEMGGTKLICDNVTFADEIQPGTDATFTNCSFESNEESVYAVWIEDGSATFTNCTFTGYRGLKMHEDYGSEISSVVVKGCTFSNITKKPGIAIGNLNADTTVSITDSAFINCQAGDQGKYIYETDTDVTTFNFKEENNTVLHNATIVSTKDDLLALSAKNLTGNNGKAEEAVIVIGADIDMGGTEFSAVIAQRGDKLTIVGNGHKISNVKVVSGANDNTTGQASMFYAYPSSTLTVSNLTLENITVTAEANSTGYAAAVVGYCEGAATLDNVDVVNAAVTGAKSSGMLVGHLSGSLTATDCDLSGTVTLADFAEEANGHYAGKYVGTLAGAANLTNCTVNVTVGGNLNAANIGEVYGRKTAAGSSNLEYANTQAGLQAAIDSGATEIALDAGTYTFPASFLKAGSTLICAPGTVFDGKTGLNINGATVVGGTFTNDNDYLVNSTTVNGTYKDCVFTNCDGLRYCYAGETVVFENCVFDTDFYGVHFDGGANDIIFKNCTFTGFNTFGSAVTKLTLEECTFKYNGKGGYNGINMWGSTDLIDCTFVFDGSASYEWIDACGDNATINVKGCVISDGTTERAITAADIGNSGSGNTITVE